MTKYSLDAFVEGYNQLNYRQFSDLSLTDIRELMAEYEDIDPMISQAIFDAYIKVAACQPTRAYHEALR